MVPLSVLALPVPNSHPPQDHKTAGTQSAGTQSRNHATQLSLKKMRIVVKLPKAKPGCQNPSAEEKRTPAKKKPGTKKVALPTNLITSEPLLKKTRTKKVALPTNLITSELLLKKTRTKKVLPTDLITSEPLLNKSRTKRRVSELGCENRTPAKKKPRTKRKPPTGKVTVVSRADNDRNLDRGIQIEASQIGTNEGDEEVSDRPAINMAPLEIDRRNSQTTVPVPPDVIKTQDTSSVPNKIPVSVYAGGEVQSNQMGALYSIPPIFTFIGTQGTTFEDVRNEINNFLKIPKEDRISLNIQARYNAVPNGRIFFALLAVNDDRAWRLIYEMATSGSNWRIVELFVKLEAKQTSQNADPEMSALMRDKPSLDMPFNLRMGPQSVPKHTSQNHISNPNILPRNNSVRQRFMPMSANPSQNMPYNAPVRGSYTRPNIVPINMPTRSIETRNNNNNNNQRVRANSSRAKQYMARLQAPIPSELIPFENVVSFSANQVFKSKKHLWFAVIDLHIKANIEISVVSSSESELMVRCKNEMCRWKLHAAPTRLCSNWSIKTCPYPHICNELRAKKFIRPELNVEAIAKIIRLHIQQNSELKIIKLHELVRKEFPTEKVSYSILWHARKAVIEEVYGNWEESYALIPKLLEAIKNSNPETTYDLQSDGADESERQQRFGSVAWAFGPCINAYRFIRTVISVKSLALLGKYNGRLLIACGYDAENESVPLAFALVNVENESNWVWFMRFLRQKVIGHNQLACVISDCDGFTKNAFRGRSNYMPKSNQYNIHRFCIKNISECLSNVCKEIELVDMFRSAARKTSLQKFEKCMSAIRVKSPETYVYLNRLMKNNSHDEFERSSNVKWAQCEDGGYRYGIMNGNCAETVKSVLTGCRHLPVAAIIENTFYNCMRWFYERKRDAVKQADARNALPDTVIKLLQRREDKARSYHVDCSEKSCEVVVKRTRNNGSTFFKYNVKISSNNFTPECQCRKLECTGIPCSHVIAVCQKRNIDPRNLVNSYYSLQMLVDTWSKEFYMYGNRNEWPEYNGAVIVPDETLLRKGPKKPENFKDDNGENSGKQPNLASNVDSEID